MKLFFLSVDIKSRSWKLLKTTFSMSSQTNPTGGESTAPCMVSRYRAFPMEVPAEYKRNHCGVDFNFTVGVEGFSTVPWISMEVPAGNIYIYIYIYIYIHTA